MNSSDKPKLPEIRLLMPAEHQQLADLAEDIAKQMLGPDWKEKQEQRCAELSTKTVQRAGASAEAPAYSRSASPRRRRFYLPRVRVKSAKQAFARAALRG
jgi:hypothetical protein